MPTTTSNRYFSPVVNSNHAGAPTFGYLWDNTAIASGSPGAPITGAWRPTSVGDFGSTITLTGSGISVLVDDVAVTGGFIAISNNPGVTILNGILPVSGSVNATTVNPIAVTGGFIVAGYTGVQPVSISSATNPVYITGVGFSPTFQTITGSQFVVPVGAHSYGFTVISGNGFVNAALVVQGVSYAGGGYGFSTLTSTIAIGTTGGCIFASYE